MNNRQKTTYLKIVIVILLLKAPLSFGNSSYAKWSTEDTYDSLFVNEPYLRVKTVQHTYDYNEASTYNHGEIITYGTSGTCSSEPYRVIAKWTEILESEDKYIKKYQGTCNTIARFNYICPGDSVIVGIESNWNPYNCSDYCTYYDRVFSFTCAFAKDESNALLRIHNCTDHPYKFSEVDTKSNAISYKATSSSKSDVTVDSNLTNITHVATNSTLVCPDNKILKGIKSWYNADNKDRQFSISCCNLIDSQEKVYAAQTSNCSSSSYSSSKQTYNQTCSSSGNQQFIYQIDTKYDSSSNDRTISIQCCSAQPSTVSQTPPDPNG